MELVHPPSGLLPGMPTAFIPLARDLAPDSRIHIFVHEEILKRRREDCCDFAGVKLGENISRDIGISVPNTRLRCLEISYAGTNAELSHGKMCRQLSEMLHRVSTGKLIIFHRQADFLKGLSSCCHEGRLV
jgi:hypothetical protein